MEDVVIGLGTELFGQFSWWYIDIDGWWYDYKCVVIILYSWIHWCGHFLDMSPISLRGLFRKTPIICEWLHDHSPARAFISCHLNGSLPKIFHFIGQKSYKKGALGPLFLIMLLKRGTVTQRQVIQAKVAVTLKRWVFVCPGLLLGVRWTSCHCFFFEKAGGNNHTVLLGFLGLLLAIVVAWGSSYCWLHETLDDSWIRLPLSFYICK